MPNRRVAVFTGSRAEYGLLYPTLKRILESDLELLLLVTGSHLSAAHGNTVAEIHRDGFCPALALPLPESSGSELDVAEQAAAILSGVARYFCQTRPDLLLLLGDRFETFAAAQAALYCRIPIAHLHGGEATEGVIDEAIRHAITKMSHLHFVAAEAYRTRVIQLGESPDRVWVMGATCIDNIREFRPMNREQYFQAVSLSPDRPLFVVTHHPLTLIRGAAGREINQLLQALDDFPEFQILFTGVNADMENQPIREAIEQYVLAQDGRARAVNSLGRELYYNTLTYASAVIGNSSSGILEAPFFGVPTVDIGSRQQGRVRADSVIHVPAEANPIRQAIERALSPGHREVSASKKSPFGSLGQSPSQLILQHVNTFLEHSGLMKNFYNL